MSTPTRLEQFNASYEPAQDRIVLRFRTSDDAEFRFWITRRFLSLLWPILMKMADEFCALKAPADPLARSAIAEMAHGNALGQADFKSTYTEGSTFPLGAEPVLLAKISLKPIRGEVRTLVLLPQAGQGINLDLDEKLVHILARLLQQTATAAEWGLKLDISPGAGDIAAVSSATEPRMLH